MRVFACAVMVAAWAAASGIGLAQNVYPDPGFEASGEPGAARTGSRAGHLSVGARTHWGALGGRIDVQPFARYRVTEWVRARPGTGTFYAPYCYEWDSYEWSFLSAAPVRAGADWVRTEAAFVSPHKTMYVHPLAYMDAENGEAWVDDVVVEKVAEPAQVMAALLAKPDPTDDEKRLIARWHVSRGNVKAAAAVMRSSGGLTRADIATVIAGRLRDARARRPYLVEMVACGGPTYNEGVARFREAARGLTPAQQLEVCTEALKRNPGLDRAGRAVRLIVADMLPAAGSLDTFAETGARLRLREAALSAASQAAPTDSPAAAEVRTAVNQVHAEQEKLAARRSELGRAVVRIGGRDVTARTHAIVVPDRPTPQEAYAARELRYHLELITGEDLPIVPAGRAGAATPLTVGRVAGLPPALRADADKLGLEGMRIQTDGPAIHFLGNRRGVLYAVSAFLEDNLGCRWFTPDCATWPKTGVIDVPKLDRRTVPPLEYRAGDYPVLVPGEFAARLRMNGRVSRQTDEQGGTLGVHSLAHTFAALVPPEKYFKDHPEYFSLVNGQRQSGYAQLCLTNPDVLRIAVEGVRKWIHDMPDQTVFSVSQNDTANYCECPACSAIAAEEGSQAGPMLRFVNAVADAIAKDHPNIAIETLAYQYTRKPPKITRPRPNVIVCLCSIECCFIHPLGDDPFNKSFVDDIVGWSRICKRLWIWDYIINYAHSVCPFPNLYVLKPNIRFFLDHGVTGIYEESCYYTKGSELQELRNYIIGKTLWDPDYDTDRAIDEFCAAYYGAGAPFVRRYIDLIHKSTQQDPKLHVQIYTHPRQYLTPEVLAQAGALFDQAEAAVKGDPTLLHRVEVARLPVIYAQITLASGATLAERGDRLVQDGGTDVTALAQQFERIARAEGLTMIREGGPDATLDAWLASIPRRPREVGVERLANPALEVAVLPELGGRIWRMRLLQKPRELLRLNGREGAWVPGDGGYEEYSESGYRSPGWNEAYTVTARGERSITLEAGLPNGLKLTRQIALDAARPLVTITSTLTNTGSAAQTACLRVHPELQVASTQQASVRVKRADGTWRDIALANPADPNAEKDVWLRGEEMPSGEWQVVDAASGVSVVDRIARGTLGQCLLNWSGAQNRVNLEIYTREESLAPGQSITLEHSYEAVPAEAR